MYEQIKEEDDYLTLLNSGMFWELHPELTGIWSKDNELINGSDEEVIEKIATLRAESIDFSDDVDLSKKRTN